MMVFIPSIRENSSHVNITLPIIVNDAEWHSMQVKLEVRWVVLAFAMHTSGIISVTVFFWKKAHVIKVSNFSFRKYSPEKYEMEILSAPFPYLLYNYLKSILEFIRIWAYWCHKFIIFLKVFIDLAALLIWKLTRSQGALRDTKKFWSTGDKWFLVTDCADIKVSMTFDNDIINVFV